MTARTCLPSSDDAATLRLNARRHDCEVAIG
jgi:hypothetical protein